MSWVYWFVLACMLCIILGLMFMTYSLVEKTERFWGIFWSGMAMFVLGMTFGLLALDAWL